MGPDQGLAPDIRPDSNSLRGPAIMKFTQTGGHSPDIRPDSNSLRGPVIMKFTQTGGQSRQDFRAWLCLQRLTDKNLASFRNYSKVSK